MLEIIPQLHNLDTLYYTNLATYEQQWQEVAEQVSTLFPGFCLAHVEVYTEGQERVPTGRMRHVLVPQTKTVV